MKAKHLYKARVDWLKAHLRPWEQVQLVREIIAQISDEYAIKMATYGGTAIANAEPIFPLPNEDMPELRLPGFFFY